MDILQTLCELQDKQKRLCHKDLTNTNGVVPVYCRHKSLCQVTNALGQMFAGKTVQIVQIGHWCSSKYVRTNWLQAGNLLKVLMGYNAFFACSGSDINSMIEFHNCELSQPVQDKHSSVFENATCSCQADDDLQPSHGVKFLPIRKAKFRQKSCLAIGNTVAWHIVIVQESNNLHWPVYSSSSSSFFQYHDRDYWALNLNDRWCPTNIQEFKLQQLEDICCKCIQALNGTLVCQQLDNTALVDLTTSIEPRKIIIKFKKRKTGNVVIQAYLQSLLLLNEFDIC